MKGTYVIIIELEEEASLRVGALGKVRFPSGYYAYVGSAQKGIEQRVARHRTKSKRLRWHIDYLLERGTVQATLAIPFGGKRMECEVAARLNRLGEGSTCIEGFGASDCDCVSHLFHLGSLEDGPACVEAVVHALSTLSCVHPYVSD